ncbi:MAG: hypothetical protein Roseis2KO_03550 [Roseivirga sp.]
MTKIAMKASNGLYVTAEDAGKKPLIANRENLGSWETFELQQLDSVGNTGNQNVALKAVNGLYVSYEPDSPHLLIANKTEPGTSSTFQLIGKGPGKMSLLAGNGKYVMNGDNGPGGLQANAEAASTWELFSLFNLSKPGDTSLNQFAYVPNTDKYVFGAQNSIPNMKITGFPEDADYARWGMLHDGNRYRIYIWKLGTNNRFYQGAFNPSTEAYEFGFDSIREFELEDAPASSDFNNFGMLFDGKDYRFYLQTK